MEQVHLEAKIRKPRLADSFISRQACLARLEQSAEKLVILHATMGYGKTVLMNLYGNQYGTNQAWYHLTATDNDVMLFLEYLAASVRRALPAFSFSPVFPATGEGRGKADGSAAKEKIREREDAAPEETLYKPGEAIRTESFLLQAGQDFSFALQKALDGDSFCLMLDDFQVIESQEIYEFITALLSALPQGVRVFITTRGVLPQFALRLLLNGEALILTAEELCFSAEEIGEVFAGLKGLESPGEAAQLVREYTEGWPAGVMFLYLYLKSWRGTIGRENIREICRKSMVHDFLMYECFRKLPFELQQFLTRTSVLEYLQSGVCSVVAQVKNAESMLNYLISEGIFIQKMENEINTYRYHQLFQNFLLSQLDKREQRELCRRAAGYYLKTDEKEQAVGYAIAAGESSIVMQALETAGESLLQGGKLQLLHHWMEALEGMAAPEAISAQALFVMAKYRRLVGEEEEGLRLLEEALRRAQERKEEGISLKIFLELTDWKLSEGEAGETLTRIREEAGRQRPGHRNWFAVRWQELRALLMLGLEREATGLCGLLSSAKERYAASESGEVRRIRRDVKQIGKALEAREKDCEPLLKELKSRENGPEAWDILAARRLARFCTEMASGEMAKEDAEESAPNGDGMALAQSQESIRPVTAYTAYGFLAEGYCLFRQKSYREAAGKLKFAARHVNREQLAGWLPGENIREEMKRLFMAMENGYEGEDSHLHLFVGFFGGLRATVLETGDKVKWRTRKAQECVAFLAQNRGKRFSREELTAALWELEELPANEVAAFHNLLSSIRKSLSPYGLEDLIVYDGKRYSLQGAYCYTELEQAERLASCSEAEDPEGLARLREALEQFAGHPYLPEFDSGWSRQQRDYYEVRLERGLFLLGDYDRRRGRYREAERLLKKAIECSPYLEEAQESLLRLYGERRDSGALNQLYGQIRFLWESEAGTVPERLSRLYREMAALCRNR